jgi:RNA polymerase sigma-70 factor (ECF subfamily)
MDAVYRLSFAILGNEADARDAAQDTFVAAWRQIRGVRDADRLQRVTVNAARMVHRSRRRRGVREIASVEVAARVAEVAAPQPADVRRLESAMARLPVDQRAILVLHHLEGQGVAELAVALDIPVGTVKSRLHTARGALHRALVEEQGR